VEALALLTPLNILLSIFGGIVFGFAYKDIYIDHRSIFLFIIFVLAFTVGRILFVVTTVSSGAGIVGTVLFLLYCLSFIITRIFLRRNKSVL
jgi:hypothetical protein